MNVLRKHLSVATIAVGSFIVILVWVLPNLAISKYFVALGITLLMVGILKFISNVNRMMNRLSSNLKKIEESSKSERGFQGRSRFEVSSLLKKLSPESEYVKSQQKSWALTSAIDYRTRALFAEMTRGENSSLEEQKEITQGLCETIEALDAKVSSQDIRTRKIFAHTSEIHNVISSSEGLATLSDLREQILSSNKNTNAAFSPAFYGISNRIYNVERSLENLVKIGENSAITQWQINHRTLLGGLGVMRTASSFQHYLRPSDEILFLIEKSKIILNSDVICGGLSEFSLFYLSTKMPENRTAWILCRNVLEQEFLMGIIDHFSERCNIVPILREEIDDFLEENDQSNKLREIIEKIDLNEVIAVSSEDFGDLGA